MPSSKRANSRAPDESPKEAEPSPDAKRILIDEAIETAEKLAESELEMARLFLERGKPEIARRRLTEILDRFARSAAAKAARKMLRRL